MNNEAVSQVKTIVFDNCQLGIGIRVWGGASTDGNQEKDFGIFIKHVLPNGLAHSNAELQEGDLLLSVNHKSLANVTCDKAVDMLREAATRGMIILTIYRGESARVEYEQLLSSSIMSRSEDDNSSLGSSLTRASSNDVKNGERGFGSSDDLIKPTSTALPNLHSSSYPQLNNTATNGNSTKAKINDSSGRVTKSQSQSTLYSIDVDNRPLSYSTPVTTRSQHSTEDLQLRLASVELELSEQRLCCQQLEEQLLATRREAQGLLEARRALTRSLRSTQHSDRSVQQLEQDYERVVWALERELANRNATNRPDSHSSNGSGRQPQQQDIKAIQDRQLSALSSQLLKLEFAQKTLDVALEQLLHFVEHVHVTLDEYLVSTESLDVPNVPVLTSLMTEAQRIVRTVRTLLESQPLPFGWEECYTSNGRKYYINHLTQTTSWNHPVSHMSSGDSQTVTNRLSDKLLETFL